MKDYLKRFLDLYKHSLRSKSSNYEKIRIHTLGNPGWYIYIHIINYELKENDFNIVDIERAENDWIYCRVEDGIFKLSGGLNNIGEMITLFTDWAEGIEYKSENVIANQPLDWLTKWYELHCQMDWENYFSSDMHTDEKGNWHLKIALNETELEDKTFEGVKITRTNEDWFCCEVKGSEFLGYGGPTNLPEMLDSFRGWATQLYDRGLKIYTWHDQL